MVNSRNPARPEFVCPRFPVARSRPTSSRSADKSFVRFEYVLEKSPVSKGGNGNRFVRVPPRPRRAASFASAVLSGGTRALLCRMARLADEIKLLAGDAAFRQLLRLPVFARGGFFF